MAHDRDHPVHTSGVSAQVDRGKVTVAPLTGCVVEVEDPRNPEVAALLERHLAFCHATTPREHAFALDLDGLLDPTVTFFALRLDGELLGVGALKELDLTHGEIKSMHTAAEARGLGVGRAIVDHLLVAAAGRGYTRVSLETGTTQGFAPARALYTSSGFVPCGPFADYADSPDNTFMTVDVGA
jgi:putative acetyltransferase